MKLSELVEAIPGCRVRGSVEIEVAGIALDSRAVRQGYLFAALRGRERDGRDFLPEAASRGAVAVLVQEDFPKHNRLTSIVAGNAREALARLADRFYGSPSRELDVAGVTGTNGKTTVCYLLRDMLRAAGKKPALLGTIEYLIGARSIPAGRTTPEAPQLQEMMREAVDEGCDSVVMEVSSHALEQRRVECIEFDVGVFTNLGRDHIDYHRCVESYFGAKESLFRGRALGAAVVNADDPWGKRIASSSSAPVLTYGVGEGAMLRASSIVESGSGSEFDMEAEGRRVHVSLPLLGRHNVYNALAAAGAALSLATGLELIAGALSSAHPPPGRLEEVRPGGPFRVFVDYAHTAEALESALRSVRACASGRVVLVFGCGGDRDREKRAPMGRAAAGLADVTFITSDNPRREDPLEIMREIEKGFEGSGARRTVIGDRREAIAAALAEARRGDVVLVAGKGHERVQELASTVIPFSDRDVIAELMGPAGGEVC